MFILLYGMYIGFDRKIRVWDILPEPAVRHWNQASDIVRNTEYMYAVCVCVLL